jgi:cytochrome o ubiquinol oxidase subunit IV
MSKEKEHGTTQSYVIGFILSLIFTIIPYYLVVNKVLTGNTLLVTILGIAVLQMFIQIFFFLHLGRGPKPFYNVVFFFATAGLIVVVVGASLFIMNNLYRNMSPGEVTRKLAQKEGISQVGNEPTGACQENKDNHIVVIKDGVASPGIVQASRCDTLTFLNEDEITREMVFGPHPDHHSYGGEDRVVLEDRHSETITLNETGNFMFHDHLDSEVTGYFTVAPR